MKIGFLTTSFPRFEGDASGSFVLGFARTLAARGHSIRVLSPEPRSRRQPPGWGGISVIWVPYARPRSLQRTFYRAGAPENLRNQPATWLGAASFPIALHHFARSRLQDCDALVSHWCYPGGTIASQLASGRPHLCVLHATDVRWASRLPFRRHLARRLLRGATATWFLTPELRDAFFAMAGADVSRPTVWIGPMGVDRPPPGTAPIERTGSRPWTVLFLGRLVALKGVDRLLRAVAELPVPVRVRVAGDGPERRRLRQLALRLGVDATFEGWVQGARKEALLRDSDVLVAPSHADDGVPTVLLEALVRGLPIVSTRSTGIARYLEDERHALLVADGDIGELGRAILRLHSDLELQATLSCEGKRRGRRFIWSEMAPTIESLLSA